MAFYPQSVLDEIRDRISIVSYIGECIPLKKAGRNHKGVCPFHAEKTPSFMVSDEKEIFHCFGCGEGGNIFSFVMKYEGLSFHEAVEQLASRAGVELPKKEYSREEKDRSDTAAKKKKLLFRVNQIAAEFFRENLQNAPAGERARNYMKSRGIFNEISTQHFLGYADDSWDALNRYLKEKNVPPSLAEELGLIKRRQQTGDYFDFFRGRIIFPIKSQRFEILGFGGRILPEFKNNESAKYLNSPDSVIYHKSYSVYALDVAHAGIRQRDEVIIVEGYMDVLALNQAGIINVVAPLGTALTASHIRLLGRYTKNMVLLFDGDSAGIMAAERSLPSFMEVGIQPKVMILPEGQDPDDWIRANSKEDFEKMLIESGTLLEWFIKRKAAGCGNDLSRKFGVISEIRPHFNNIGNSTEFMHYRRLLADAFRIDENDLTSQFEYRGDSGRPQSGRDGQGAASRLVTERMLLALMLEHPGFIARVREIIEPSYFSDASFKTLFELLVKESAEGKVSVGRILDMVVDEELKSTIHMLSAEEYADADNTSEILEDCIKYLSKTALSERLKMISDQIRAAENSNDQTKILELMSEKNKLLAESL